MKIIKSLAALLLCVAMLFTCACGTVNKGDETVPKETESEADGEKQTDAPDETDGEKQTEAPESEPQDVPVVPEETAKLVTAKSKVYLSANDVKELEFAHYEDASDIPYIDIETAVSIFHNELLASKDAGAGLTMEVITEGSRVTLKRETGKTAVIDFEKNTISFEDYDAFIMFPGSMNPMDLVFSETYEGEDGQVKYFLKVDSIYVPGEPITIDLSKNGIYLDSCDGKNYIPFQTFNDVFFAPFIIGTLAFNGESFFFLEGGVISEELKPIYYNKEKTERSKALAEFTYNELCLFLDLNYGLKIAHNVNAGFKAYLTSVGLDEEMLDTDPAVFYKALANLLHGYFGDFHSSMRAPSPYFGSSESPSYEEVLDPAMMVRWGELPEAAQKYFAARVNVLSPTGGMMIDMNTPLPYMEIGNTAYITFDQFTLPDTDYYSSFPDENPADTIGLIIYAHSRITRENSPIENIVIDLSCNLGGESDAVIFLMTWILGYYTFDIMNPTTGATASHTYMIDINLDGVVDENDILTDKNVFCLTSPVTFSCANLAAAVFKNSDKVTLIGEASSGGACAVMVSSAADGTLFQVSSNYCLAIERNGAYYHIDKGVEPDIKLASVNNFYNREKLTEYINSLIWTPSVEVAA